MPLKAHPRQFGYIQNMLICFLFFITKNQCPSKTFLGANQCKPCIINCLACRGGIYCDRCQLTYQLNYIKKCEKCDYQAELCQQCESCHGNQMLTFCDQCCLQIDGNCVQPNLQCPSQYFKIEFKCYPCQDGCKQCLNDQSCEVCKSQFLKIYQYQQLCVQSCPDGYFPSSDLLSCSACSSGCKTCNQLGFNKCLQCANSYTRLPNGVCMLCDYNILFVGNQRTCVTECPNGFFSFQNRCLSCLQKNCKKCSLVCQICFQGYYLSQKNCLPCNSNCQKCQNQKKCTKCNKDYYMHQLQCQTKCPSAYYSDNMQRICQKCESQCPPQTISLAITDSIRILDFFNVICWTRFDMDQYLIKNLPKNLFNFSLIWQNQVSQQLSVNGISYDIQTQLIFVKVIIPPFFNRMLLNRLGLAYLNITISNSSYFPNKLKIQYFTSVSQKFEFIPNSEVQSVYDIYFRSSLALSIIALILAYLHYILFGVSNGLVEVLQIIYFSYMTISTNVDGEPLMFIQGLKLLTFNLIYIKFSQFNNFFGNFYLVRESFRVYEAGLPSILISLGFFVLNLALYRISRLREKRICFAWQADLKLVAQQMKNVRLRINTFYLTILYLSQFTMHICKQALTIWSVLNLVVYSLYQHDQYIACLTVSIAFILIQLAFSVYSQFVTASKKGKPFYFTILSLASYVLLFSLSVLEQQRLKLSIIIPRALIALIRIQRGQTIAIKINYFCNLIIQSLLYYLIFTPQRSLWRLNAAAYALLLGSILLFIFNGIAIVNFKQTQKTYDIQTEDKSEKNIKGQVQEFVIEN